MKKIWLILMMIIQIAPLSGWAQTMVTTKMSLGTQNLTLTSFSNYPPIATTEYDNRNMEYLQTIFDDALQEFAKLGEFKLIYILSENYDEAINVVRRGNVDVLLGIYYGTKRYSGLEYVYPAVINNPINIIMLPQTVSKVKNTNDLKTLKGTYSNEEYFSDYMLKNFESFNIKPTETTLSAYEKLFSGEVDYIAGTYYYNYAKVCELGLKNYVSFSQTALWSMPMFIGVSKASPKYKRISAFLKKTVASPEFSQKINRALKNKVKEIEIKSQGVVPPEFIRKNITDELTPADEQANNLLEDKGE